MRTLPRKSFPTAIRILAGGLIGLLAGFGTHLKPVRALEELSIDLRLRARGTQPVPDEVRLVGVDDADLKQMGRWPLPRGIHADALRILGAMGVKQVVFDVLVIEPSADPAQDELLRTAAKGLAGLTLPYFYQEIGGEKPDHFLEGKRYGISPDKTGFIRASGPVQPLPGLGTSFGAANVMPDRGDEIIRRIPMFFQTGDRLYPGLAMQALMKMLDAEPDQIRIHPGQMIEIIDTPRGTVRIPIDAQGNYRVNFLGNLDAFRPAFSYTDLYRAVNDSDHAARVAPALKDRMAIIGDISTGSADMVTTPVGRVPGAAVQATVLGNILSGRHLRLPSLWATVLGNVLLGLCFGATFWTPRMVTGMLATAGWLAGLTACALLAAHHDFMLPITSALGTVALASITLTSLQALHFRRAAKKVRDVLSPFVDQKVVEHALDDAGEPLPTSERRELTILFSDIRGFTRWTEKQEADEVARTLNEYFAAMVPIVRQFGGTLDKLIGDGMMVFVGAPDVVEHHALVAIQIAWAMQQEVGRLAAKFASEARDQFGIGIGIHSGFVTVGNFGSDEFHDYTVIGRAVNLAARVEGVCPAGRILITPRTQALAGPAVRTRPFGEFRLDGMADSVPLVEITGVDGMDEADNTSPEPPLHHVDCGNRRIGPYPAAGIRAMIEAGSLEPGAIVTPPLPARTAKQG